MLNNKTEKEMSLQYEVLMDKKENKRKCTLHPLSYRKDFSFSTFLPGMDPIESLKSEILLHVNGKDLREVLEERPSIGSIATIDCNWRKVEKTLNRVKKPWPILAKIPPGFLTAYPRKSKEEGIDPERGLASIEALFIATAFLSIWDLNLLKEFHFRDKFLQINEKNWKKYTLGSYG